MVPKDEEEFRHMIKTAVDCHQPVALRYPRGKGEGVERSPRLHPLEIGKGEILREGRDALILAIGVTVYPALRAAERLDQRNISTAVINCRFLKPLDRSLICDWAKRTGRVLTVEENVLQGGFGSAVLELLEEEGLYSIQIKRLGIPDLFVEHGPQSLLREKYGIDENGIYRGVMEMFQRESSNLSIQKTHDP